MNEAHQQVLDFRKQLLAEKLAQCTEEQQAFFKRLYPNGVSEEKLEWATQQCINTLKNNAKKPGHKEDGGL